MKKFLMTLTLALGAAIAIPTVANAQSNAVAAAEKTAECCKEQKACCKEEGKACCADAQKPQRKMKGGKFAKADRKMKAPKDSRMKKEIRRGSKENPMMKGITLSDDQKAKMKELREKNLAAEKKTKADLKARSKEEMQKLRAEFDKDMEKILDKDQLKQYQANKAEMEAKRASKAQAKLPGTEKKTK